MTIQILQTKVLIVLTSFVETVLRKKNLIVLTIQVLTNQTNKNEEVDDRLCHVTPLHNL